VSKEFALKIGGEVKPREMGKAQVQGLAEQVCIG